MAPGSEMARMEQFMAGRARWVYETGLLGCLAGAVGGVAEVLWVSLYGAATGADTAEVARSISTVIGTVLPMAPWLDMPVVFGLMSHMLASAAIAVALVFLWHVRSIRAAVGDNEYTFLVAALAVIWAFNFFVLLPAIGPYFADVQRSFTEILPYPVSLFSKLLFGLSAAAVMRRAAADRLALARA